MRIVQVPVVTYMLLYDLKVCLVKVMLSVPN